MYGGCFAPVRDNNKNNKKKKKKKENKKRSGAQKFIKENKEEPRRSSLVMDSFRTRDNITRESYFEQFFLSFTKVFSEGEAAVIYDTTPPPPMHARKHASQNAHMAPPNNSCPVFHTVRGVREFLFFSLFFKLRPNTATTTPTNHDGLYNNHFKPQREIEKPRAVGGIEISAQFQSAKKSVEGPPIKQKTTATIRKKKKEPNGK
jgi:hypothetical protein